MHLIGPSPVKSQRSGGKNDKIVDFCSPKEGSKPAVTGDQRGTGELMGKCAEFSELRNGAEQQVQWVTVPSCEELSSSVQHS